MAIGHLLSHVSIGDWIGYIAALLVFLTFWMVEDDGGIARVRNR